MALSEGVLWAFGALHKITMTFKQKIYAHCLTLLNSKIQELENTLQELSASAASDTKSSAGDKHETARAMVQIEQENVGKQLNQALEQKSLIEKTASHLSRGQGQEVRPGSLVRTNKGYLYLSLALGKISIDGLTIMVISPQSPLGFKLMGLQVNGSATINGVQYIVQEVD